jgi:hypothetical protein
MATILAGVTAMLGVTLFLVTRLPFLIIATQLSVPVNLAMHVAIASLEDMSIEVHLPPFRVSTSTETMFLDGFAVQSTLLVTGRR